MDSESKIYLYEKILEYIHDGVVISDEAGRIVSYNKAQEKLEEKRANEMVGKYLWEAYGYEICEQSEHKKVLETGKSIQSRYKAHIIKNGTPKFVSYSTYPVVKNGIKLGAFSVSKNETKLHELLEETIELKRQFFTRAHECRKHSVKVCNGTRYNFSDIIGNSSATIRLIREAQTISWLGNNILIVGDTGTGKEMYAQSIHNYGMKNSEPFIAINCAAIPENLLEGILFGTTKGAFTGAVDRSGLFEEAKEGTLFLDELNSMPIAMQTKLLRVLQERQVNRVGGASLIPIHCRIICAMNEDPISLLDSGVLRKDLFYRIAGHSLYISPLKDRMEELMTFVDSFISKYNVIMNRKVKRISTELRNMFFDYNWPGNIRELEHVVENLMIRAEDEQLVLDVANLPTHLVVTFYRQPKDNLLNVEVEFNGRASLNDALKSVEDQMIRSALEACGWNITATAKRLGIIRQSLIYRMKKLNIERSTSGNSTKSIHNV